MSRWLARLFQLRPGEGRPAALMSAFIAGSIGNIILLQTFNDATFLAVYGADLLPVLFIVSSVALSIASTLYGGLAARVAEGTLALVTPLSFAAILVVCRLLLGLELRGFVFALYVVIWVTNGLVAIVAWNFVRGGFDSRQVKRMMPLLGASAGFGATLAGLGARTLVPLIGTENLLLVAGAVHLGVAALARGGRRYLDDDEPAPAGARESLLATAREGFGLIRRNRLMMAGTAMLICSVVVKTLVDYQFKTSLKLHYGKDEMAAFLGNFYAIANVLELGVQLVLSGWLLRRFGLVPSLASRPAALGALGLASALHPRFGLFVSARLADGLLNRTWYKAGSTQMLAPIPARRASRIKLTQEGTIEPLVVVATGALLLVLQRHLTLAQLSWPLLAAAAVWLVLALRVDRLYLAELAHALDTRLFDADQDAAFGELVNPATLARLASQLGSRDAAEVTFALRLAAETGAPLADEVAALLNHQDGAVRREAATTLARLAPEKAGDPLRARLTEEPDPLVAGHLLRTLTDLAEEESLELAHQLASHREPEVRSEALLLLFKLGGLDGIIAATYQLAALQSGSEDDRLELARIVGRLEVDHLDRTLLGLLRDPDPRVRRAALDAARHLHAPRVLAEVVRLLGEPALQPSAERALIAAGALGTELALPLLERRELGSGLGASEEAVAALVRIVAATPSRPALAAIEVAAGDRASRVREAGLAALGRLAAAGIRPADSALASLIERELAAAIVLACHAPRRDGLLQRELELGARRAIEHLFGLLAVAYGQTEIEPARQALHGRDPRARANALEYLDTLLTRPAEKLLLALLEAPAAHELAGATRDALGVDPLSEDALAAEAERDRWLALLLTEGAASAADRVLLERIEILAASDLFERLSLGELWTIAEATTAIELAPGDSATLTDQHESRLAVVHHGRFEVDDDGGARPYPVGPGASAGEAAAFGVAGRSTTLRAIDGGALLAVPAGALAELVDRNVASAAALTASLVARVRAASDREAKLRRAAGQASGAGR